MAQAVKIVDENGKPINLGSGGGGSTPDDNINYKGYYLPTARATISTPSLPNFIYDFFEVKDLGDGKMVGFESFTQFIDRGISRAEIGVTLLIFNDFPNDIVQVDVYQGRTLKTPNNSRIQAYERKNVNPPYSTNAYGIKNFYGRDNEIIRSEDLYKEHILNVSGKYALCPGKYAIQTVIIPDASTTAISYSTGIFFKEEL